MSTSSTSQPRPNFSRTAVVTFMLGGLALGGSILTQVLPFDAAVRVGVASLATGLLSVALGIHARRRARRADHPARGSDLVVWGMEMAVGGVVISLIAPLPMRRPVMGPLRALNNLKEIGLALDMYRQDHGRFPPSVVYSPDGRPLYSWRVLILPYLDQQWLYDEFDRNEAWDSPHNRELLARRPSVYDPVGVATDPTMTYYQVFNGAGAAFEGRQGLTLTDFPDGPERTLLVVEASDPVPWTKPIDLTYQRGTPLPPVGGVFKGKSQPSGFGDFDGCTVVFADTHVQFIPRESLGGAGFPALITRNGMEPNNDPRF